MKNERRNKRLYKTISCIAVFLVCLFAFVGLALGNSQKKVNAGVVITTDNTYTEYTGEPVYNNYSEIGNKFVVGLTYSNNYGNVYLMRFDYTDNNNTYRRNVAVNLRSVNYTGLTTLLYNYTIYDNGSPVSKTHAVPFEYATFNNEIYLVYDIKTFYDVLISDINGGTIDGYYPTFGTTAIGTKLFVKTTGASITPCDNIYDLKQNDVAIIYISDVSGFDDTNYQPEITINWGYIDSSDNTVYAAYSPTVNVMKATGDLEIWLNIPTDAGGTVYDSVILNQQALLNLITDGASTANANIYAFYVWLLSDRIQWGLLNFNTAGLPASAQSMNYFTSYTTKYDYINSNTGTMTCRLSISDNFNFITIKNQPVFSVNTINTTLRQGGLLPAWALYNWARGTASGFTSGTQAGAAPYQPGNSGYNEIYQAGYDAGITAQPAAAWYEAAFCAVDAFLNIHIFPSITFGELFGIPFVITVVWFIIRMFRGGGSG